MPVGSYTGPNADIAVWATMAILTLALICLTYIPGLNRIPEFVGVYRLIWRSHVRQMHAEVTEAVPSGLAPRYT